MARFVVTLIVFSLCCFCYGSYWDFGAFVATNTVDNNMAVWNANNASSFTEICDNDNGIESFTPAYTTDISTRTFIYVHQVGKYNAITKMPFEYSPSEGFDCSADTHVCYGKWDSNQTTRIFYDPALKQTILFDLDWTFLRDTQEYNQARVWKFGDDCVLQFVDSFKIGPILDQEGVSVEYDHSNHRLYTLYDPLELYSQHRIRAVDIRSPTLLYDYELPVNAFSEVYSTFDLSSGKIIFWQGEEEIGNKGPLQGHLFDPIHLRAETPTSWVIDNNQIGPGAQSMAVNWRQGVIVTQVFDNIQQSWKQYSFRTLTGEPQETIILPQNIDYGWYYDPLLSFVPMNINTANATALSTLPGLDENLADLIVEERKRNGNFVVVESSYKYLSNITETTFQQYRPYVCI